MKKTLTLLAMMALVMLSCGSPEKDAQKLIKDFFKTNIDNPSSYEAVEFGTLDSVFTTLEDNADYRTAKHNHRMCMIDVDGNQTLADDCRVYGEYDKAIEYLKKAEEALNKSQEYTQQMDKIRKSFKPQFNGWKMSHSFRCENAFGAVVLNEMDVYFDKDITKIVGRGE